MTVMQSISYYQITSRYLLDLVVLNNTNFETQKVLNTEASQSPQQECCFQ